MLTILTNPRAQGFIWVAILASLFFCEARGRSALQTGDNNPVKNLRKADDVHYPRV